MFNPNRQRPRTENLNLRRNTLSPSRYRSPLAVVLDRPAYEERVRGDPGMHRSSLHQLMKFDSGRYPFQSQSAAFAALAGLKAVAPSLTSTFRFAKGDA